MQAKAAHHAHEIDQMIDRRFIDPSEVRPIASCDHGAIVYVEWKGPRSSRWIKLRVVQT